MIELLNFSGGEKEPVNNTELGGDISELLTSLKELESNDSGQQVEWKEVSEWLTDHPRVAQTIGYSEDPETQTASIVGDVGNMLTAYQQDYLVQDYNPSDLESREALEEGFSKLVSSEQYLQHVFSTDRRLVSLVDKDNPESSELLNEFGKKYVDLALANLPEDIQLAIGIIDSKNKQTLSYIHEFINQPEPIAESARKKMMEYLELVAKKFKAELGSLHKQVDYISLSKSLDEVPPPFELAS